MVRTIIASLVCCCAVFLPAGVSFAQRHPSLSADDLAGSLKDFRESVSRLEQANGDLSRYNANVKEHIKRGKLTLESLAKERTQLDKDLNLYSSKTEKKSGDVEAFEKQMDQIKDKLRGVEGDMLAKEETLEGKARRQEIIWQQLAAAKDADSIRKLNQVNAKAVSEIAPEKTGMTDRLARTEKRLASLEEEVNRQSLLRQDPDISLPKLTAERDRLRQKLTALMPSDKASAPVDPNQIKKLNLAISQLNKSRSEYANLLQILDTQYDKNQKLSKNTVEEKKLQSTISDLKKDNKMLFQQATDLKFEMVGLDKRKSQLEQAVRSAKQPR